MKYGRSFAYWKEGKFFKQVPDPDQDMDIPNAGAIVEVDGKKYKVYKAEERSGSMKDEWPYVDVYISNEIA